MTRNLVKDHNSEAILWDGCDDAIMGMTPNGCVVYSIDRLLDVFIKQGMTEEEAVEWVDYNILGAYVGEYTPVHIYEFEPQIINNNSDALFE